MTKGHNEAAFSVDAMFKELEERHARSVAVTGLVRPSKDDRGVVLFARQRDPSRWIPIPEEHVLRYDYLGHVQSDDKSYPMVNLHLKQPSSSDAKTYAGLFALDEDPDASPAGRSVLASLDLRHSEGGAIADIDDPGRTPCRVIDGKWLCPGDPGFPG